MTRHGAHVERGVARRAPSAGPELAPGPDGRLVASFLAGSGAVTLVYETLWVRAFTTRFGASAPAVAGTVAATFAGLALGNAWFARRAPRWRAPLRAYGRLELGAAAAAALVPSLVRASTTLTLGLPLALLVVFATLVPATFLLGGTLPAAAQALDDGRGGAARWSAALYAANTVGAIVGVLLVPFVLLPALGATRAYWSALAAGAVLGGAAISLGRRGARTPAESVAAVIDPPREPGLAGLAFASGFTLLALEVVWTRMLAQVHPSSVHAFAVVLAVFLGALALGAAVGNALVRRGAALATVLGRSWVAAGLATIAAPLVLVRVTDGLEFLAEGARAWTLVLVGAASFGPATVCAGVVLPVLLAHAARRGGSAGRAVGRLLAWNTAGSVLGPLVATFAGFALLGSWGCAVVLGLAQLALPFAVRGASRPRPGVAIPVAAVAVALAWASLGAPRVHLGKGEELVWLREGSHGIAAVLRERGQLRLKLDNSYTLGGTGTAGQARMLGHLPLLLSDAPHRVAFLGLGTGLTASAALRHPVEAVTVFELVPEVAAAARVVFADSNLRLLDDPRVRLVVDDARSRLAAEPARYDVIVGDLVVPWRRGESGLFTREHFETVRAALAEGGLFCQWIPAYQTSDEELRIVVASFLDAFPDALLWRGDFVAAMPSLGLVGCAAGGRLDPAAIDGRLRAGAAEWTADSGYLADPAGFWLHLVGFLDRRLPWVAGTRRNTQDLPWLELIGARGAASAHRAPAVTGPALLSFLDEVRAHPSGPLLALDAEHGRWRDLGAGLFRASNLDQAGDEEGARRSAFAILDQLPPALRTALFGPEEGG